MTREKDMWTAQVSSCYVKGVRFTIVLRMDRDWERQTLVDLDPEGARSLHNSLGKYLYGVAEHPTNQDA